MGVDDDDADLLGIPRPRRTLPPPRYGVYPVPLPELVANGRGEYVTKTTVRVNCRPEQILSMQRGPGEWELWSVDQGTPAGKETASLSGDFKMQRLVRTNFMREVPPGADIFVRVRYRPPRGKRSTERATLSLQLMVRVQP